VGVKAVVSTSAGAGRRWRWVEVAEPALGRDDVLVGVSAAGLNHADVLMRDGRYLPSDASWRVSLDRVGFELAGTVVAVGPAATGAEVGDAVMAQAGGACAELVAVDAGLLLPLRGVDPELAAGLPSGLLTEYDALAQARFGPGDDVLIAGASTGVGRIGVQLAHALGAASVIATARGDRTATDLRRLGADLVIDTNAGSISDALHRAGHRGCAVALDHVGGALLTEIIDAAPPNARIVQIGRLAGAEARIDLDRLASRRLTLIGTTFRDRSLQALRDLVARVRQEPRLVDRWGAITPTIDRVFTLDDPEPAAARLASGQHAGKIILRAPS
jgi:NADPH2:quinone reductase